MLKRQKRPRALGPVWLRWVMFLGGSLCMGLAVAVAVQWVVTGSLSIVWEWFVKWPTYLLLTGVLYGAVVFTLGALLGRLWLSAILVGVAGLVLSLVDYFKTAINGTPRCWRTSAWRHRWERWPVWRESCARRWISGWR